MKKLTTLSIAILLVFVSLIAQPAKPQIISSNELATLTQELVAMEDKWNEAFIRHDVEAAARILADEFIVTGSSGNILTKVQMLEWAKNKEFELSSVLIMDPMVQKYGDIAILHGMANMKGKENGKEWEVVGRFTDVWLMRDGRWQAVSGHNSPAEKEMPITTSSTKARELFIEGRDKSENGEGSSATKLFDQAIAQDSTFALAYCYRSQRGDGYQIRRSNITKATALAGKVTLGEQLYIQSIQAAIDNDQVKWKECLDKLLAMYPKDKRILMNQGAYLQNSSSDYKGAIGYYEKGLKIDKDFAPLYNLLGYAHMADGNFSSAEKAFQDYIRLVPDKPNPYDSYAELLLKMGRYEDSIVQYKKALEKDSQFISSLASIGNNYLFKGDYAKARENYQLYLDKATTLSEKSGGLYLKAISYLYENNLSAALKGLAEWRSFGKKEKQPNACFFSLGMEGYALTEMGKPAEGLKKFKEARSTIDQLDLTERQKDNFRTYVNAWTAYSYAANMQLDKAKSCVTQLKQDIERRKNPGEKDMVSSVQAYIDIKEKNYDSAIDQLSKVVNDPFALYYQGQAYLAKGDKVAAKRLLKQVINWNENTVGLAYIWNQAHQELKKLGE